MWIDIKSMAEKVFMLEERTYLYKEDEDESMVDVYGRVFERYFGCAPGQRSVNSKRNRKFFDGAQDVCTRYEIARGIYVAAQMWGVARGANFKRIGFLPNMLTGDNALLRYNAYCWRTKLRYKNTTEGMLDPETQTGQFVARMTEDETRVGVYYVAACMEKTPVDWYGAIEAVMPEEDWFVLDEFVQGKITYGRNLGELSQFSKRFLRSAKALSRVRAACAVAERYQHGLSRRVGFRGDFEWDAFAKLIVRLFGHRVKEVKERVTGVPGREWGIFE